MAVSTVPAGYHTLTPACALRDCAQAIELYRKVFGAEQTARYDAPDGTVAHCELRFGDSMVMMGEATPQHPGFNAHLMIYVPDCDAVFQRAVAAGFQVKEPPKDQFYGDRNARVVDPFGNECYVSTHVEDVSEEELRRRMARQAAA
ncbi:MAG TPA: VOC family protein [Anaeromyxobacteraceae bacterium]|nr:VOC family protein [Anaeromyxobacteraceae bacterium]